MIETIGHQLVTDALLIVVMMAVLGWVESRRGMPRPAAPTRRVSAAWRTTVSLEPAV